MHITNFLRKSSSTQLQGHPRSNTTILEDLPSRLIIVLLRSIPPLQTPLSQILNFTYIFIGRSLITPYRLHMHSRPIRLQLKCLTRAAQVGLRFAALAAADAVAVLAGAAVVAVSQDVKNWSQGWKAGWMSYSFRACLVQG